MKIVVLAGGTSTERDISLVTSHYVCESLRRNGHEANVLDVFYGIDDAEAIRFFLEKNDLAKLEEELKAKTAGVEAELERRKETREGFFGPNVLKLCKEADVVFMGLHGANGEDGKIQGTFELLDIKYTGTDSLSSAISMDKDLTKKVLVPNGIPMPKGIVLHKGEEFANPFYPCVVKPANGGSSVGVSIVNSEAELSKALDYAFESDDTVLVEEYVKGREFSAGVLNGEPLPVIEIVPLKGWYDYENKYADGATKHVCPAKLTDEITKQMQHWAVECLKVAGVTIYGRVDMLLDENNNIFCLEINTLPGMTPTSLLPHEASEAGISFDELTQKVVELSINR
ncbi:MAG: D-alanine--D-alanine ligase [Lachnospira sp.]|nr:D-alanine--D-alanine ligase [Lachnospira sp.]